MRALVIVLGLLGLATATAAAQGAPRAAFRLERGGGPHAQVPFNLDLMVEGFDEAPAPEQPKLEIAGATVTPAGATPSVSRSIQIVNGKRTDSTRVTWVLRWRVLADKPGALHVPSVTVKQGSKTATAASGEVTVDSIPSTDEMKLELVLPDRPVYVGETVPVKLVWLFRPEPSDQSFAVPMMSLDTFVISAPPTAPNQRNKISLSAGAKDLDLPYEIDTATVNGVEYNRLTLTFFAAPRAIPPGGKLQIPPTTVVAALRVGRPDFFGRPSDKLFRATDIARALEIKPLPESGKPAAFSGAVGEQFSIAVHASRSVVSLGEPLALDVVVKSDQRLDNLTLGKLDGEGRLPKDKFTVPAETPTGELSDDGKTKTFKVDAQVTGPATEIPALAFSYFDPKKGTYQTIHSEPIALSVKGGTIVGANAVVSNLRKSSEPAHRDDTTEVPAELALSSPAHVDDAPLGGTLLWIVVGLLYAVPLALLGFRSWQLRTQDSRDDASEVHAARKRVEELLDRAGKEPARDLAGPLVAALRELARVTGHAADDGGLLARIETESFAPEAAAKPLSPDLRSDAAGLLRKWTADRKRAPRGRVTGAAIVLVLGGLATDAHASLDDGRALYQHAMTETSATARKEAFARAAVALGEAARAHPDQPELLTDWGNAALASGDLGTATLAYRRALAIDGRTARARSNLAWLRSRQPDPFRPPTTTGAADTLLFFHHWPQSTRLVVGAGAFALAILMLVPWTGRRRRSLAALAILPAAVWLAMLASVVLEDRHADDAVVIDGVVLRAADSAGAPAALGQPLPRGAEVNIVEQRDAWTRIQIASGATGWVPAGAVERVRD